MKMPETLSKIAKNKFKKVAEDELKELLNKDIKWVKQDKHNNLIGMFDIRNKVKASNMKTKMPKFKNDKKKLKIM